MWTGQMAASYAVPLPSTKQTKTGFLLESGGGGQQTAGLPPEASPPSDKQRPLPSDKHAAALPGRGVALLTLFFFPAAVLFKFAGPQMCPALVGTDALPAPCQAIGCSVNFHWESLIPSQGARACLATHSSVTGQSHPFSPVPQCPSSAFCPPPPTPQVLSKGPFH